MLNKRMSKLDASQLVMSLQSNVYHLPKKYNCLPRQPNLHQGSCSFTYQAKWQVSTKPVRVTSGLDVVLQPVQPSTSSEDAISSHTYSKALAQPGSCPGALTAVPPPAARVLPRTQHCTALAPLWLCQQG
ncbi:hypothetical protein EK904_009090 [Melospiza melodia maxima]|nr:hypothetical protein EK904_009090 [Melospiza melodia maxima]